MTYKMTVRGAPPRVWRRVYRCTEHGREMVVYHESRDEAPPECPDCATVLTADLPAPAMRDSTNVSSKAVDETWKMAQEQYGLTDMKDNLRPGDIAAPSVKPIQGAERSEIMQELSQAVGPEAAATLEPVLVDRVKNFWQGPMASGPLSTPSPVDPGGALNLLEAARARGTTLAPTIEGSAPIPQN